MNDPRTITLEEFIQLNIDEQKAVSAEIARILDEEVNQPAKEAKQACPP